MGCMVSARPRFLACSTAQSEGAWKCSMRVPAIGSRMLLHSRDVRRSQDIDRAVADGMHPNLQPGQMCSLDEVPDVLLRIVQMATGVGAVEVGVIEAGRVLETGAIHSQAPADPRKAQLEGTFHVHGLVHQDNVDRKALGDRVKRTSTSRSASMNWPSRQCSVVTPLFCGRHSHLAIEDGDLLRRRVRRKHGGRRRNGCSSSRNQPCSFDASRAQPLSGSSGRKSRRPSLFVTPEWKVLEQM